MRVSSKSLVWGLCALHPGLYTLEQVKLIPNVFAPAMSSASCASQLIHIIQGSPKCHRLREGVEQLKVR